MLKVKCIVIVRFSNKHLVNHSRVLGVLCLIMFFTHFLDLVEYFRPEWITYGVENLSHDDLDGKNCYGGPCYNPCLKDSYT